MHGDNDPPLMIVFVLGVLWVIGWFFVGFAAEKLAEHVGHIMLIRR